jgi:hypothetical protein
MEGGLNMKRMTLVLTAILMLALPAAALAQTEFEEACGLLALGATQQELTYRAFEEALDTVDMVAAGELSAQEALANLHVSADGLRAMLPIEIVPSEALSAYMLGRGLSPADFQAVADGAIYTARAHADAIDCYIASLECDPDAPAPDTSLDRAAMILEKRMDFVALNTVLFPETDEEAAQIQRLVVEPTGYLTDAGLPWERDLDLCMEKYDALEAEYEALLSEANLDIADFEAGLDAGD